MKRGRHSELTRRRLLAGVSACGVGVVAGCLSVGDLFGETYIGGVHWSESTKRVLAETNYVVSPRGSYFGHRYPETYLLVDGERTEDEPVERGQTVEFLLDRDTGDDPISLYEYTIPDDPEIAELIAGCAIVTRNETTWTITPRESVFSDSLFGSDESLLVTHDPASASGRSWWVWTESESLLEAIREAASQHDFEVDVVSVPVGEPTSFETETVDFGRLAMGLVDTVPEPGPRSSVFADSEYIGFSQEQRIPIPFETTFEIRFTWRPEQNWLNLRLRPDVSYRNSVLTADHFEEVRVTVSDRPDQIWLADDDSGDAQFPVSDPSISVRAVSAGREVGVILNAPDGREKTVFEGVLPDTACDDHDCLV